MFAAIFQRVHKQPTFADVFKGDVAGHAFHGNQWHTGADGNQKTPSAPGKITSDIVIDTPTLAQEEALQGRFGHAWMDHVNSVVMYHGTSSAAVATIKAEGLIPTRGKGSDQWWADTHGGHCETMQAGNRKLSVYFTPFKDNAKYYARCAATVAHSNGAILTIRMPVDTFKTFAKQDEKSDGVDFRAPIRIPPEWIIDAKTMTVKDPKAAAKNDDAEDIGDTGDTEDMYAVIMCDDSEDTEKKDFSDIFKGDSPGHPFRGNQWSAGDRADMQAYPFLKQINAGVTALGGSGEGFQTGMTNAHDLIAAGVKAMPEYQTMVAGVAKALGCKVVQGDAAYNLIQNNFKGTGEKTVILVAGLKGADRIDKKVMEEEKGNYNAVRDVLRGTIAVNHPSDIPAVLKTLKDQGLQLSRAGKDRYSHPQLPYGYRDVLLNVTMPSGHVTELQINTKEFVHAKEVDGHKWYETERRIKGHYGSDSAAKASPDSAEYVNAITKQVRIYGTAYRKSKGV